MTAPPPRRPWRRRKRTWAAVAVWLAVAYPLSAGPACYADGRGWLTQMGRDFYEPVDEWCERDLPGAGLLQEYFAWWYAIASD